METAKITDDDFTIEDLVSKDAPHLQYNEWFRQAQECPEILEPNAAALGTTGSSGIPSVRMVLMTRIGPDGGYFYTNRLSKKAIEIEENANAGAVLYWQPLQKQVRIEGPVKKLSDEESAIAFRFLPRGLQISVHINEKFISSSVINGTEAIKREFRRLQDIYANNSITIPKPQNWGGYVIDPVRFEFWQGKSTFSKLSDRIVFMRQNDSTWIVQQVAP